MDSSPAAGGSEASSLAFAGAGEGPSVFGRSSSTRGTEGAAQRAEFGEAEECVRDLEAAVAEPCSSGAESEGAIHNPLLTRRSDAREDAPCCVVETEGGSSEPRGLNRQGSSFEDTRSSDGRLNELTVLSFNAGLLEYKLCGMRVYSNPPFTQRRLVHMPRALLAADADIICLQEVYSESHADAIIEATRHRLPFVGRRTSGGRFCLHNGLMVISKFPIVHTHFHRFEDVTYIERCFASKGMLEVAVDIPSVGVVAVFNIHLASGAVNPESEYVEAVRAAEIRQVLRACDAAADRGFVPLVIGDLNAAPDLCASNYKGFVERGWRDCWLHVHGLQHHLLQHHLLHQQQLLEERLLDETSIELHDRHIRRDLFVQLQRQRRQGLRQNRRLPESRRPPLASDETFSAGLPPGCRKTEQEPNHAAAPGPSASPSPREEAAKRQPPGLRDADAAAGEVEMRVVQIGAANRQCTTERNLESSFEQTAGDGGAAAAAACFSSGIFSRSGSGISLPFAFELPAAAVWAQREFFLAVKRRLIEQQRKWLGGAKAPVLDPRLSLSAQAGEAVERRRGAGGEGFVAGGDGGEGFVAAAAQEAIRAGGKLPPGAAAPSDWSLSSCSTRVSARNAFPPFLPAMWNSASLFLSPANTAAQGGGARTAAGAGLLLHESSGGPSSREPSVGEWLLSEDTSLALDVAGPSPPGSPASRGGGEENALLEEAPCGVWTGARDDEAFTWDARNPLNKIGPHASCHGLRCDYVFMPPHQLAGGLYPFLPVEADILLREPRVLVDGCCFGCFGGGMLVTLSDHYALRVVLRRSSDKEIAEFWGSCAEEMAALEEGAARRAADAAGGSTAATQRLDSHRRQRRPHAEELRYSRVASQARWPESELWEQDGRRRADSWTPAV